VRSYGNIEAELKVSDAFFEGIRPIFCFLVFAT
jgi:hypothetical protein